MLEISHIQIRCLAGHRFMVKPNGPLRCPGCARDTYWTGNFSAPSEIVEDKNRGQYGCAIDTTQTYRVALP